MSTSLKVPSYQEGLQQLIGQLGEMLPEEALNTFNTDAKQLAENHTSPLKLKVGDQAPNFSLPNATGEQISLEDLLKKGSVVLTFYRGTWCPYCNLALNSYQKILPQIKEAGANMVAISPQSPDHSLTMKEKNELAFEVLSDAGNKIARQFTTVFKNAEVAVKAMGDLGIDFHSFYSDESGELPVPALYIIDPSGKIQFAQSEGGDYRGRVEPQTILDALKK